MRLPRRALRARPARRPSQMMIGTVPPSALQAAPVTYEARSEAEEDDDGRNLLRLGEAAERPAGCRPWPAPPCGRRPAGRRGRRLRARRRSKSALVSPRCTGSRPSHTDRRRAGTARASPPCHRVVRHARRRTLARGRGDVDDRSSTPFAHRRQRSADRPDVTHQVQLPVRVPLVVGNVLELRLTRRADVVDEAVDRSELGEGAVDHPLRSAGSREVGLARAAPRPRPARRSGPQVTTCAASPARSRAVARPIPAVEPVTTRRGHAGRDPWRLAYRGDDHDPPGTARRDGLEPRPRSRALRTRLNEVGRKQAHSLAHELADEQIDAVYSSDLIRARATAEAVAASHGLEVQLDSTAARALVRLVGRADAGGHRRAARSSTMTARPTRRCASACSPR